MKRRHVFPALAAAAALPAHLPAQTVSPDESFKLDLVSPDAPADGVHRFFTADQFAALVALSDLIAPSVGGRPGAAAAETPAFLDFLLAKSPRPRQTLYQQGLDALNRLARTRHQKAFAQLEATQATALLAPLRQPWTYKAPTDPLSSFLRAAKSDILRATANSRAVALANTAGRRRATGVNAYWHVID